MSDVQVVNTSSTIQLTQADVNSLQAPAPKVPAITVPTTDPATLASAVRSLKEIVETREGQRGSILDKAVTYRELFAVGIANLSVNGVTYTGGNSGSAVSVSTPAPDMTIPPAPTGLTVSGAVDNMILTWSKPLYGNHSYTEVWRSDQDNLGTATLIGTSVTLMYVDPVGAAGTKYYWIRFVSTANVAGAYNAQAGVMGVTGADSAYILSLMTGTVGSPYFGQFPFFVQQTATTINGVAVPAGVYIGSAYIANGTITNAKIANAAIDDAKIANLSADKITAGNIDAARMSANIVTALTGKFSTLSALAASLGAVTIGTDGYLKSSGVTSFAAGPGVFIGYDTGIYKFRVGDPAGHNITWNGSTLTVKGNLSTTSLSSISANAGTITAGRMQSADGLFVIDLDNKFISITV